MENTCFPTFFFLNDNSVIDYKEDRPKWGKK